MGHRTSQCLRADGSPKPQFATRSAAREHRKRLVSIHREPLNSWQVYPCEDCSYYHVGGRTEFVHARRASAREGSIALFSGEWQQLADTGFWACQWLRKRRVTGTWLVSVTTDGLLVANVLLGTGHQARLSVRPGVVSPEGGAVSDEGKVRLWWRGTPLHTVDVPDVTHA